MLYKNARVKHLWTEWEGDPFQKNLPKASGRIFPMEPLRDLGRSFVLFGGLLVLIGVFLYFGNKLPFRLGKLPGDIVHRGEHTTFYFPIVTCLVLSVVLSLLFWLVSHFRR